MRRAGEKRMTAGIKGRWLLTFNDMMTLLFAFFVLIVSMSHLESAKVRSVAAAVRRVLGAELLPKSVRINVIEPIGPNLRDADIERAKQQALGRGVSSSMAVQRQALYRSLLQWEGIAVLPRKDGFIMTVSAPLLFISGTATLSEQGRERLKALAALLQKTEVGICVEGHTDALSVAEKNYPSNWEFSMAMAANIVKCMINIGGMAPDRFSAVGYADAKPKWPKLDAKNSRLNSRIEIVLKYREMET